MWYKSLHRGGEKLLSHLGENQGPFGLNLMNQDEYAGSSRIVRTDVYHGYA
jgi:hypothetical protein